MKTARELKDVRFGPGHSVATVPAGTRVVPAPGTRPGEYFIDDFSFLPSNSLELHDATHYGIRVGSKDVTP